MISNPLDIDSIHGDIHDRSCRKLPLSGHQIFRIQNIQIIEIKYISLPDIAIEITPFTFYKAINTLHKLIGFILPFHRIKS